MQQTSGFPFHDDQITKAINRLKDQQECEFLNGHSAGSDYMFSRATPDEFRSLGQALEEVPEELNTPQDVNRIFPNVAACLWASDEPSVRTFRGMMAGIADAFDAVAKVDEVLAYGERHRV